MAFIIVDTASTFGLEVCWGDAQCDHFAKASPAKASKAKAAAVRQKSKESAPAVKVVTASQTPTVPSASGLHRVAIQVNERDEAAMNLALNNAKNVIDHYKSKGQTTLVEIVAYGPGLHMLRDDTSPVKDRIASLQRANANISVVACGNSQANQSRSEEKPVPLIAAAKVVPSGVVRLIELQQQGYAYIRP